MSEKQTPDKIKTHTATVAAGGDAGRLEDLDYSFPPDDQDALPLAAAPSLAQNEDAEPDDAQNNGQPKQAPATPAEDADAQTPPAVAAGDGGDGDGDGTNEEEEEEDDDEEDEDESPAQSIFDHFRELRTRLLRIAVAIVVGFGICWFFHNEIAQIVYHPLIIALPDEAGKASSIIFTGVAEGFLTHMKLAIVAGIFLMSPFIFYQIWAFITPGLYDNEKRFMIPVAISSALCFIAGGLFCYFVVFPNAFRFFMTYSDGAFQAMPSMKEYFGFTMQLMLAFGIIFEMPLFCFFLAKMGLVRASAMRRFRRYFIVIAFILGAFLTPPDPLSQLLMAGPLLLLYEISIIIASIARKEEKSTGKGDDEDEKNDDGEEDEEDSKSHA